MNIKTLSTACALALAAVTASTNAHADEVRLFATATFGDQEFGFGNAEYGWGSGNNIFTLGASLTVAKGLGSVETVGGAPQVKEGDTEFNLGLNGGYTYLFNPEGNTGFLEGRVGSFDLSEFSDQAFYELSVGYRWYLSDRAAIGWNIVGYEQRRSTSIDASGDETSEWNGNPFTRLQLIISFD